MHQLDTVPQFNKQVDTRYWVLAVVLGVPIALANNGEDSDCSSSRHNDESLQVLVFDYFRQG